MKSFRKVLEKFGIISNLQEKSEKVLKEDSCSEKLSEQIRLMKDLEMFGKITADKPKEIIRAYKEVTNKEGTKNDE